MTTAPPWRLRMALVAALIAAVALMLSGCSPTQIVRGEDDVAEQWTVPAFYKQPRPLPPGGQGELIRSQRVLGAPDGSTAWRVLFHSTDTFGHPVVNSGLVIAPTSPAPEGGRTVVSWGHPTTGSAQRCAPSSGIDPFDLVKGLTDLLKHGYVVTYTDYTGMGTAGPNSYLVGGTEGRNVLDAARAARQLLGRDASDRLVLWGHSQGGQAALFAAQLARAYAPELDLRAVAVAAPAVDLGALLQADIGDVSGVTISSYAFTAFAEVYGPSTPGAELDSILTPAAVAALPSMAELCLIAQNKQLHAIGQPLIGDFLSRDPETTEPWKSLLAQNTPGAVAVPVPLFVAQGETDSLVRPADTAAFVAHERSLGVDVTFERIPDTGHGLVAVRALDALFDWLPTVGADASEH
ncbi:alpha/beta fold hydrolase [Leifsonia sp. NPDC058292]|uniref:alpha/beta fold hydrolase n=1 Tax=Leifsonia sp. NPDC058292 TaxID=3346428 RepID=UPI0036D86EE5